MLGLLVEAGRVSGVPLAIVPSGAPLSVGTPPVRERGYRAYHMNVNSLAKLLGDSTYGFLAINLLFGLFCAIIVWRRLRKLRFRNEDEQQQFLNELNETLNAGDFDSAIEALRTRSPRLCRN